MFLQLYYTVHVLSLPMESPYGLLSPLLFGATTFQLRNECDGGLNSFFPIILSLPLSVLSSYSSFAVCAAYVRDDDVLYARCRTPTSVVGEAYGVVVVCVSRSRWYRSLVVCCPGITPSKPPSSTHPVLYLSFSAENAEGEAGILR